MARPGKVKLNRKTVGRILKTHKAPVQAAAAKIFANIDDPEARIDEYVTDRYVNGIVVPADKQAKDGTATRAAQQARGG